MSCNEDLLLPYIFPKVRSWCKSALETKHVMNINKVIIGKKNLRHGINEDNDGDVDRNNGDDDHDDQDNDDDDDDDHYHHHHLVAVAEVSPTILHQNSLICHGCRKVLNFYSCVS